MAIIKPEQLSSGTYSISGSFSGSFHGDGSDLNNLPSNVISTGSYADFPDTGSEGYIYIDNSANIGYLWDSGSIPPTYVNIAGPSTPPEVLPLTFANAATVLALVPSPLYNNGISGSGAVLTGSINGVLSDNTNPGKIDYVYTPIVGDVILVKNQSTGSQNGLYTITSTGSVSSKYVLTRTDEYDVSSELFPLQVNILAGTNGANKSFIQSTPNPVIGTSSLVFSAASPAISVAPQIAFVDTVIDTPLTNIIYATGSFSSAVPGNGATLTSTVTGSLGTWNGLSVNTNSNITGSFTKVLVTNQTNPAHNGDYSVLATGSSTVFWKLQRINNNASGFDRYTRFFLVSNTSSSKAGRMYFTRPNSPVLTNATIGTAPINIFEYGGGGSSTPAFPFTGSAIITGSLTVTGSVSSTQGFTGSLLGTASLASTASFVVTAQTASYVLNAVSSSFATTASYALNALSASYAPSVSPFPFTGSALITGSLGVTGSIYSRINSPATSLWQTHFAGERFDAAALQGRVYIKTNWPSTATEDFYIGKNSGSADTNASTNGGIYYSHNGVFTVRNTSTAGFYGITLDANQNLTQRVGIDTGRDNFGLGWSLRNFTNSTDYINFAHNSGRVGIGWNDKTTSLLNAALDVRAPGSGSTDTVFRITNAANTSSILSIDGNGAFTYNAGTGSITFIEGSSAGTGQKFILQRQAYSASFTIGNNGETNLATSGLYITSNASAIELNGGPSGGSYQQSVDLKGNSNLSARVNSTGQFAFTSDTSWYNGANGFTYTGDKIIVDGQTMAFRSASVAPTSTLDTFKLYSADVVAGNAAPHFRTEAGNIVKLYTQAAVTSAQGIADTLTNLGLLTGSSTIATTPAFPFTGSALITGSLGVTGSVSILAFTSSAANIFTIRNSANTQNLMSLSGDGRIAIGLGAQILGNTSFANRNIVIGNGACDTPSAGVSENVVSIGYNASASNSGTALGANTVVAFRQGTAIGYGAYAGEDSIALGFGAMAYGTALYTSLAIGRGAIASATLSGIIAVGAAPNYTNALQQTLAFCVDPVGANSQTMLLTKNANLVFRNSTQLTSGTHWNTTATNTITIHTGSIPDSNITSSFQLYSSASITGNAAPHFRTEAGNIVKLYTQPAVTSSQGIADALTNLGLLTGSSVIIATATSGPFGIANPSGSYTYYTSFSSSMAAAPTGSTVEMFADVVETGAVTITLKNGVNINGNGHTYTLNTSTTSSNFIDGGAAVVMSMSNITLVRTGSGAGAIIGLSNISNRIVGFSTFLKVESNNSFGITNYGGAVFSGYINGFTVTATGTGSTGISLIRATIDTCNAVATTDGIIVNIGTLTNSYGESTGAGNGIYVVGSGYASNCNGKSNTGYGIQTTLPIYNSTGYSAGNYGIFSSAALYNCNGISAATNGIWCAGEKVNNCNAFSSGGVAMFLQNGNANNCTAYSTVNSAMNIYDATTTHNCTFNTLSGATAVIATNAISGASMKNCVVINNWNSTSGHGVQANANLTVINCSIKVSNTSANCLNATSAITMKYANNVFEGSTTPVNANITQGTTNTHDNQGNIII